MSEEAIVWAKAQRAPTRTAKFLLLRLAAYADASGRVWAHNPKLMGEMQATDRTVRRCMRALEGAKLIERTGEAHSLWISAKSGAMRVTVPVYQLPLEGGDMGVPPGGDKRDRTLGTPVSPRLSIRKREKEFSHESEIGEVVEVLRSEWPKHVGRGRADWPKVERALRELARGEPSQVRAAVQPFAKAKPWGSYGPPNLENFIRSGRWRDFVSDETEPFPRWAGPPEVREAVVAERDERFARNYLDPSKWDEGARAVLPRNATAAEVLSQLRCLDRLGAKVERGRAA